MQILFFFVFLGLVACSAALPVKSSLSDEAITADFGVLSLFFSFYVFVPLFFLFLVWRGRLLLLVWELCLGFRNSRTNKIFTVFSFYSSTMPDWRIILVQDFYSLPPSPFVFYFLWLQLFSPLTLL
jgi:hypothetical protein